MDLSSTLTADTALYQTSHDEYANTLNKLKHMRDIEKAEETGRDFEAVFISEMVKPMFEGLNTDGMFGGGKGEEVFRGIMIQEYGRLVAQTGSIGLASQVKDAMIRMQSEADGKTVNGLPAGDIELEDFEITETEINNTNEGAAIQ